MRGILVQSLVSRGVPFDLALETATQIRDRIADQGEVTPGELSKLAEQLLADRYHLDDARLPPVVEPLRVRTGASVNPFSKGMLAVSLQGAGLEPSEAYEVAQDLETRLLRDGRREIERSELRVLVTDAIERAHGASAAERYQVFRRALDDGRPIFVLIGGSTGVGKTSIAVEVARRLEISRVIGTDSIRQIMRLMFSPDLMPEIHSSTFDAYRLLESERPSSGEHEIDPERVISGYREQAQKIAVGVHALLDRALQENTSMLVEGVNLLPSMLDLRPYERDAHVIYLVVATLDQGPYRERFTRRAETARRRASDRYLDHLEEIHEIQDHILAEAEQFGIPIIDNVRLDDAIQSVIRSVIAKLKQSATLEAASG